MFEVMMDVFGIYTWGKNKGQTNPKSVVSVTMFGRSVKEALGKLNVQSGAFFKVTNVKELH